MDLCSSCQSFNFHAFSTAPDKACSYRLVAVERAARENCSFCKLLYQCLQQSIIKFPVEPNRCWVRMRIAANRKHKTSRQLGLQLSELEVYLADSAFESSAGKRTDGIFLNLAADPGTCAPVVTS